MDKQAKERIVDTIKQALITAKLEKQASRLHDVAILAMRNALAEAAKSAQGKKETKLPK